MKNTATSALEPRGRTACCTALAMAGVLTIAAFGPSARAGVTDLSNQPLATTPTVQAKPNLLFILDNSGSMDSAYMPDDMSGSSTYGYKSAQCNGVAYDPTLTYAPPLNADGTSMPNSTFGAALDDGYASSGSTTNLDSSVYYTYSGSERKMGWVYTSSGPVNNTFLKECKTGASSASSVFTPVTVTSASSEAQNYANWYSYYRKRYLLMRTAMGRAISALDSSYRVGFSTISDKSAVDGTNKFRDTKDFDSTQKTNFYNSLYTAAPSGNTPLRGALSKAGRYFAKKVSGQTYDPMQYSCQRNYALLSTDGYWNTGLESTNAPRFGPYQLDNATLVGNQDGSELRPMKDDTKEVTSTVTPYSADASRVQTSVLQSRTITWTKVTVSSTGPGTVSNGQTNKNNCTKTGYYLVTTTTQTATEKQTQQFTTPQSGTSTYTVTEVRTDGVVTSSTQSPASLPNVSNWINGNTTVVITDTSTSSNPSTTTPIEPPSYGAGSSTQSCTQSPPSSGVTKTNDAATKTFAPTNVTYSNSE